jgi:hypothetical protein
MVFLGCFRYLPLGDLVGEICGVFSVPFSWGFGGGNLWEPFVVLWPVIPFPNP